MEVDAMDLQDDRRGGARFFALANAQAAGTDDLPHIQEAQIAYFEGQLAAHRGDYAAAVRLANRNADLVRNLQNPRKLESYHELMGLIFFLQRKYPQAVAEYRQADLTSMYNKYHLALALDGAQQTHEARQLFKEVGEWSFNNVGYALVRKDALARAG
jgi:tetratricopeptide (TPR) repeat protein